MGRSTRRALETGAASLQKREMGEEWEMREETLTHDFILVVPTGLVWTVWALAFFPRGAL